MAGRWIWFNDLHTMKTNTWFLESHIDIGLVFKTEFDFRWILIGSMLFYEPQ